MERGEIYLTTPAAPDPRRRRAFLVVSRPEFLTSRYSSVVCVPLYSAFSGTPAEVGLNESYGLKRQSWARCDEVTSVPRIRLTQLVGRVPPARMRDVSRALAVALDISNADLG
ncbi:MAG: type II toxin-antitoxin system PemK/MazF family toxin [bacterium]